METITLARIAVSAATYGIDKPYAYEVAGAPSGRCWTAACGSSSPFGRGNRAAEGIVLEVGDGEKREGLKSVISVLDPVPVLDQTGAPSGPCGCATAISARFTTLCARSCRRACGFEHRQSAAPVPGSTKRRPILRPWRSPVRSRCWISFTPTGGAAEESLLKTACGAQTAARLNALCSARHFVP